MQAVVAGETPVDIRYYRDGKLTNARGLEHMTTFFVDKPIENGIDFLDRHLKAAKPMLTEPSSEGNRILR